MTVFKWITTPPGSNDTVDSSINWAEGMSPADVNNSGRGMMSAIAKWRDDTGGTLVTGGGPVTYSIAVTNQNFTGFASPPPNGTSLTFQINQTNSPSPTLSINGGTSYPIQSSAGTAVTSGSLQANAVYTATFRTGTNAWILNNLYNITTGVVPIGTIFPYAGTTAPTNFLLCFGQTVSRTTYANLFSVCSTTYNTGGEAGTDFRLPDLRSRVPAGKDNMGGSTVANPIGSLATDTGTIVGSTLGSTGGSKSHIQVVGEMPTHNHNVTINETAHSHSLNSPAAVAGVGGAATNAVVGTGLGNLVSNTGTASTNITATTALQGSGNAMALLQPTIILNYIIRAL